MLQIYITKTGRTILEILTFNFSFDFMQKIIQLVLSQLTKFWTPVTQISVPLAIDFTNGKENSWLFL